MSKAVAILLDNLQRLDMSVYEFAKRTGIPKGRIYQWIKGNGSPKVQDVKIIEQFIGQEIDQEDMTTVTGKAPYQVKPATQSQHDEIIKKQQDEINRLKERIATLQELIDKFMQNR